MTTRTTDLPADANRTDRTDISTPSPETYKTGWQAGRRELARQILGMADDAPPEREQ